MDVMYGHFTRKTYDEIINLHFYLIWGELSLWLLIPLHSDFLLFNWIILSYSRMHLYACCKSHNNSAWDHVYHLPQHIKHSQAYLPRTIPSHSIQAYSVLGKLCNFLVRRLILFFIFLLLVFVILCSMCLLGMGHSSSSKQLTWFLQH